MGLPPEVREALVRLGCMCKHDNPCDGSCPPAILESALAAAALSFHSPADCFRVVADEWESRPTRGHMVPVEWMRKRAEADRREGKA